MKILEIILKVPETDYFHSPVFFPDNTHHIGEYTMFYDAVQYESSLFNDTGSSIFRNPHPL